MSPGSVKFGSVDRCDVVRRGRCPTRACRRATPECPCAAHRSCSRIDSREAADAARLDVDDAAGAGGDRLARDADGLDRLVEADRRLQPPLQRRVVDDVVVVERLLDHHQVEAIELRRGDRRRPACRRRWRPPSAGWRRSARARVSTAARSQPGLDLDLDAPIAGRELALDLRRQLRRAMRWMPIETPEAMRSRAAAERRGSQRLAALLREQVPRRHLDGGLRHVVAADRLERRERPRADARSRRRARAAR